MGRGRAEDAESAAVEARPDRRPEGPRAPAGLLGLQGAIGNQAVGRLIAARSATPVQRLEPDDEAKKKQAADPGSWPTASAGSAPYGLSYQASGAARYSLGGQPGEQPFAADADLDRELDARFADGGLSAGGMQSYDRSVMSRLDPAVDRKPDFRTALSPPGRLGYGSPGSDQEKSFHGSMGRVGTDQKSGDIRWDAAEDFSVTPKATTYAVRVGPGGAFADHIFPTQAEAEAYAREVAVHHEADLRERSAILHDWNPVDAVRVFAIAPETPNLRSGIAPQPKDLNNRSQGTYQGGGAQVQLPYGTLSKSSEAVAVFPIMQRETAPGAGPAPTGAAGDAAPLLPTLNTEYDGALARKDKAVAERAPLQAKLTDASRPDPKLTEEEQARYDALTADIERHGKRMVEVDADRTALTQPGTPDARIHAVMAKWNAQATTAVSEDRTRTGWRANSKGFESTDTTSRSQVIDGTALQSEKSTSTKVDLLSADSASASRATTTKMSVAAGDTSTASTRTESSKLAVGGGDVTYTSGTSRKTDDVLAGGTKVTDSSSKSTAIGTGGMTTTTQSSYLVDGAGATSKQATSYTRGDGKVGAASSSTKGFGEYDADGKLTKGSETTTSAGGGMIAGPDGVGGYGNAGAGATQAHGNGVRTGQTVGGNGRFTVNVDPVVGSDPPQYTVTLHIDLGASIGATAGKEGVSEGGTKGKIDGGLNASGTVSHDYSTTMSADETKQYLKELDDNGKGGARKEMRVLALAAAGSLYAAQQLLKSPFGADAAAARAMKEGDVDETGASGTVGGTLGGGGSNEGAGLGGSASLGYSMTGALKQRVTKKNGKTLITVDLSSSDTFSASAKGTMDAVGAGVSYEGTDSKRKAITFTLDPKDPDYDANFAAIQGATSVEALTAFADAHKSLLGEHAEGKGHATKTGVSASIAGATAKISTTHAFNQSVTTDAQGHQTKSFSGSTGGGMAVSVLGSPEVSYSRTDTVSGTVTPDNKATGDASTATSETDVGATVSNFTKQVTDHPIATVTGMITGGTKVVQQRTDVAGMKLSDADFESLAGAGGTARWDHAVYSPRNFLAWQALGRNIAAANGDRARMTELLARYAADHDDAAHAVSLVVRPPGSGEGGEVYEWPGECATEQAAYGTLIDGDVLTPIKDLEAAGKLQPALDTATSTLSKIDALITGLNAKADKFENRDNLGEMLARINKRRADVVRESSKIAHRLAPKAAEALPSGPTAAAAADTQVDAEADKAAARSELDGLMKTMTDTYLRTQTQVFAEVETEQKKGTDEAASWTDRHLSSPDIYRIAAIINDLWTKTYPEWDAKLAKAKALAPKAGVDPGAVKPWPWKDHLQELNKKSFGSYLSAPR